MESVLQAEWYAGKFFINCFTFKIQFAILKINVRLAAAITTSNSKENKNEYKKTKYCFYII